MEIAPVPKDEEERLDALMSYHVLDTLPEADFDDFTHLASTICGTPIALISLIDESRQWFKSKVGLDATETPRDIAFCSHAILQDDVFIVPDSSKDKRFYDNPLATDDPFVRFYAGAPLKTPSGHNLGTLCVIDNEPRTIDQGQIDALQALARQIMNQLELRLSKLNAEDAVRTKSLFLATMSHEIRTPLNGVLGCANILLDTVRDPEQIKLVKTITGCGDSLLTLINDVLDLSKLESNKMDIENKAFNLSETIDQVIQLFSGEAGEQATTVRSIYAPDTPGSIYGDPTRVRQLLSNLLSNAIKFAPSGSVEISVETIRSKGQKRTLRISVSDDGIGISPAGQKKLFQSFSQVDASTSRKFGGTGLGLSICKSLVDLIGGEISVESEEGKGSVFSFTMDTQDARDVARPSQSPAEADTTMGAQFPLRILLAEDNKVNQLVAAKLMEKFGYTVSVVSNGMQALDALRKEAFDLVFMDCFMPNMDGFQATRAIKQEPKKYGTPRVVALTASALQEDRNQCIDAGMDDFLAKPLDTPEILRTLAESFNLKTA